MFVFVGVGVLCGSWLMMIVGMVGSVLVVVLFVDIVCSLVVFGVNDNFFVVVLLVVLVEWLCEWLVKGV